MSVPIRADASPPSDLRPQYFVAWLLCALFYLYQCAARSAPGVMHDELTAAWGGNHLGSMMAVCAARAMPLSKAWEVVVENTP